MGITTVLLCFRLKWLKHAEPEPTIDQVIRMYDDPITQVEVLYGYPAPTQIATYSTKLPNDDEGSKETVQIDDASEIARKYSKLNLTIVFYATVQRLILNFFLYLVNENYIKVLIYKKIIIMLQKEIAEMST